MKVFLDIKNPISVINNQFLDYIKEYDSSYQKLYWSLNFNYWYYWN